jgi:dihydroceramide fatty acyl 2-hydroxylase
MEHAAIFVLGLMAWTLLEYAIHAWLSHTFRTFATPMHEAHHREPHAVFAIGAWVPVAVTWSGGLLLFGWIPATIFYTGMVAGFVAYEAIHYRVHFSAPSCDLEAYLRLRHLVHHHRTPQASFGVTSALWDCIFGTETNGEAMTANLQRVAHLPPLSGASNVGRLFLLRPFRR